MNKVTRVIGGLGLGAGLMYIFDPDRGKRRRARMGDRVRHAVNKTADGIGKTSRDAANRFRGIAAEAESLLLDGGKKVSNEVLAARVRSKLGRLVSYPSSIEVAAADGRVIVSGPILASEVDRLLDRVSCIKGVLSLENRLEIHAEPDKASGLQDRENLGKRRALIQNNWSPTTRLLAGATGGALVVYAAKRGGLIGAATGTVGVAALSRALTNLEIKRIVGLEAGPRTIDIEKTINIAAPVEEVFDFWVHHEEFPQFMSNVREVRKIDEGKYHWVVAGPAGVSVEWDAEITKIVPNQVIGFRSLPGAAIEQKGLIHFTPTAEGDTTVDIKMSYNPPAGAIGHLVAMLFGADPKRQMDEDLMRMKSFIETGQAPHDAAQKKALARAAE